MPAPRKRYDAVEMKPLSSSKGGDDDDDDDDSSPKKSKMDEWLTYILHKLHALLWLVVASALAMYVDLLDLLVLGHPPARPEAQMNRFFFYVGLAGFGGWLCMAAYLILYLKYIRKIPGEWEEYWPQAIPIATVSAVSSLVAFCVAFWPVWSWLTIPCVFVLFLGVLNLAHFVPL